MRQNCNAMHLVMGFKFKDYTTHVTHIAHYRFDVRGQIAHHCSLENKKSQKSEAAKIKRGEK